MSQSPSQTLGICEAADCEQVAIQLIEVSAGKYGTLILSVCSNCVSKFTDDGAGVNAPATALETRSQGVPDHAIQSNHS
jgi:hypothetical protein